MADDYMSGPGDGSDIRTQNIRANQSKFEHVD